MTLIFPSVAPDGTVAVSTVSVVTLKFADRLLNVTSVAPLKFVPLTVTRVPTGPLVGVKPVTVGGPANTVKSEELVFDPFGVVTVIGPVVAPEGTLVVIFTEEFTVNDGWFTLLKNFTDVVPSKFVPLIVTVTPTAPPLGENDVIDGSSVAVTTKSSALVAVPSTVVTEIGPVCALAGTVAVIWFGLLKTKVAVRFGVNVTVAPAVKFDPLMTTDEPSGPLCGENPEIVGAAAKAAGAGSTRSRIVGTSSKVKRRNIERAFIGTPSRVSRRLDLSRASPFAAQPSRRRQRSRGAP
jgi:hypothetical protein